VREGFGAIAAVLALVASVTASRGEVLYDEGPVSGGVNAWTINFDYAVADSFTLSQTSIVTGVNFGVWSLPGDTISTVDWAITPAANTFADMGTAAVSTSYLYTNGYGYAVSWDSFSIPGQNLAAGTYWLVLQNAAVTNGDPIYWDENDGLSLAYENTYGQIGSESFQVLGTAAPEPSTWAMMLIGFSGLGLAGYSRFKKQRAVLTS
jgi:PEP-CTERM motif